MTYKMTIDQKPAYFHAVVTGRNSRENVARYVDEILRECAARDCFSVLVEERLEGPRLGTLDVFAVTLGAIRRAEGKLRALAYVDLNAQGNLMQFAETVAVNRAVPMAVFSTVAEAEEWLLREDRRGT